MVPVFAEKRLSQSRQRWGIVLCAVFSFTLILPQHEQAIPFFWPKYYEELYPLFFCLACQGKSLPLYRLATHSVFKFAKLAKYNMFRFAMRTEFPIFSRSDVR